LWSDITTINVHADCDISAIMATVQDRAEANPATSKTNTIYARSMKARRSAPCRLFIDSSLKPLPAPKKNVEKLLETYTKIRPYVPSQYADNPLYTRPSNAGTTQAKGIKSARREVRAGVSERTGGVEEQEEA
jgi:hypothetical protein